MGLLVTECPPVLQTQPNPMGTAVNGHLVVSPPHASVAVLQPDIFGDGMLFFFFFTLISKFTGGIIDVTDSLQIQT